MGEYEDHLFLLTFPDKPTTNFFWLFFMWQYYVSIFEIRSLYRLKFPFQPKLSGISPWKNIHYLRLFLSFVRSC